MFADLAERCVEMETESKTGYREVLSDLEKLYERRTRDRAAFNHLAKANTINIYTR